MKPYREHPPFMDLGGDAVRLRPSDARGVAAFPWHELLVRHAGLGGECRAAPQAVRGTGWAAAGAGAGAQVA